jgi:hypothetical protein
MSKKIKNKNGNPRFYGQNKLLFYYPVFQPLGSFSHMATCRSSSESMREMSLIPIFNKISSRAHTESKLDVLGVLGKLVKYIVYSLEKKIESNYFSSHKLLK